MNIEIRAVDDDFERGPLVFPNISHDLSPIYPSEWFAENKGKKPPLTILGASADELYATLEAQLAGNIWSNITVASFMAKVILENPIQFQVTLLQDWVANGVLIAKGGEQVTPLSVLDVTEVVPKKKDLVAGDTNEQADRLSLFYALLLIYRKAKAAEIEGNYASAIARKLDQFFQSGKLSMNEKAVSLVQGYVGITYVSISYKKIVAAVDMFCFKFQTAEYALIRMATLPSRYQGCAVLSSLGQVAGQIGTTMAVLAQYILTRPVAKDLNQVIKQGQGAEDLNGYFPYQLDLDLTSRSPYSISSCPSLYLWIHTMGCMLQYQRSKNARMSDRALDVVGTVNTAIATVFSLVGSTDMAPMFVEGGDDVVQKIKDQKKAIEAAVGAVCRRRRDEEEDNEDDDVELGPEDDEDAILNAMTFSPVEGQSSHGIKALQVLNLLIVNKGLSDDQKAAASIKIRFCQDAKQGTIGHFLYNMLRS